MTKPRNPVVIIPARLASQRLPDKPLADIAGEPMIVHVWRRAVEAEIGPVVVACADEAIADVIIAVGGETVMTRPDHPSGSDRGYEALLQVDPDGKYDAIVNVQADMPTIDPKVIGTILEPFNDQAVDMTTLAAVFADPAEASNPNAVKAVVDLKPGARIGRALYFSRAVVPDGDGPLLHHIGLYAFRREALARFVSLPTSPLERRERLEQLRALAAGMRIDLAVVDTVPLGVDTPADLEKARARLAQRS